MTGINDSRRRGVRANLSRLLFSWAKAVGGKVIPRHYAYYAARVPLEAVEITLHKVEAGGAIEPDTHRDALYHLAQEVGNLRREQIIGRLALDDAGILILPAEERARIIKLYQVRED